MRSYRENGADHLYIRRVPTGREPRRYRYVYDPQRAVRTFSQPQIGEKVRIAHGRRAGHYEVVRQAGDDVVEVQHDETGHRMMISAARLHDLLSDAYAERPQSAHGSLDDLMARHLREDRLPRAKWRVFDAIVDASGIDDTEFANADRAYLRWRRGQGPKPKRRAGRGELDAFEGDKKGHFTSLREAFDDATKGAQTWRDITPALHKLRTVPGFQHARLPDQVLGRHTDQDLELRDFENAEVPYVDVEAYGVTVQPDATDDDVSFAIFDAGTRQHPSYEYEYEPGADDAVVEDEEQDVWLVPNPGISRRRRLSGRAGTRHRG
jgi:hypothetical protein